MARRNIIICDICAKEVEVDAGCGEFGKFHYYKEENYFGKISINKVYFEDVCIGCRRELAQVVTKKISELKKGE